MRVNDLQSPEETKKKKETKISTQINKRTQIIYKVHIYIYRYIWYLLICRLNLYFTFMKHLQLVCKTCHHTWTWSVSRHSCVGGVGVGENDPFPLIGKAWC